MGYELKRDLTYQLLSKPDQLIFLSNSWFYQLKYSTALHLFTWITILWATAMNYFNSGFSRIQQKASDQIDPGHCKLA